MESYDKMNPNQKGLLGFAVLMGPLIVLAWLIRGCTESPEPEKVAVRETREPHHCEAGIVSGLRIPPRPGTTECSQCLHEGCCRAELDAHKVAKHGYKRTGYYTPNGREMIAPPIPKGGPKP